MTRGEAIRTSIGASLRMAGRPGRSPLACGALLAVLVLGLAVAVSLTAAAWKGRTFPGFLVMANRVIPSAALPQWPATESGDLFQAEVLVAGGRPVESSADVYDVAAARPAGSLITYTFRSDGRTWHRSIRSSTFSGSDALLMFGAYVVNGILFALIGIGVWTLRPGLPAARAMLVLGLAAGIFGLTGADLYGPHCFFRLHVLAEALFPAALAHVAFVFPTARATGSGRRWITGFWVAAVVLALLYEAVLFIPPAYSAVHNACTLYAGVGGLIFVGRMLLVYRSGSALDRQKIRVVVLAVLFGLGVPAGLLALSGVTGGRIAVNTVAFAAFLFPLGLGYGIVRHDLFEIDRVVRRLVHYLVLTVLITGLYFVAVALTASIVDKTGTGPPPLLVVLVVITVFLPFRDRLQRAVDKMCFRVRYDPGAVLEEASVGLASSLDVERIAATVLEHVDSALAIEVGVIYLRAPGGVFRAAASVRGSDLTAVAPVSSEHLVVARLARGDVVTWYAGVDGDSEPLLLGATASEVLVPMSVSGEVIAFLALGPRRAARYYSEADVQFIRTLANQAVLSILHAEAYQDLQELNLTLEQRVAERTAELGRANGELHQSFSRLNDAYRELQQSQEKLVRAERMAALGRLAAQVAHEVSTPLGAARSSLQMARDLVEEYRDSIGDPEVGPADHHELAGELGDVVRRSANWTASAARFILTLKAHVRGYDWQPSSTFDVTEAVREAEGLVHDRLRAAGRVLRIHTEGAIPTLRGDPTKLGQVLVNLITNAIDAYDEAEREGGIDLIVRGDGARVVLELTDQAGGIAGENQSHVFDELFTTKPPGRGTGLGLTIVRDIVTNHFGGRIELASVPGQGTTFTIRLPGVSAGEAAASETPGAGGAPAATDGQPA